MDRPLLDALDAWRDSQSDAPSRPEAVRRVLSERLADKGRTKLAAAPVVAAIATTVRSKAASAADEAMSDLDVPAETKAARRKALTEKPEMVAKARAKRHLK